MPHVTYWIDGSLIGEGELPTLRYGSYYSLAYICPKCGRLWGRIDVAGANWTSKCQPCLDHSVSESWYLPGSFLGFSITAAMLGTPWWGVAIEYLPLPVLEREFQIHYHSYFPKENT